MGGEDVATTVMSTFKPLDAQRPVTGVQNFGKLSSVITFLHSEA
jgi:hypothetical protein